MNSGYFIAKLDDDVRWSVETEALNLGLASGDIRQVMATTISASVYT